MRRLGAGFLVLALSGAAAPKCAAAATGAAPKGVKINGVTYGSSAGSGSVGSAKDALPPDQALRLKKIFLFPSLDDLSGALAPKLDEKLADLFMHNTRFELIRDPQVVKALSPDEDSYGKAAASPEVHREAARVTGADTTVLLRTRNLGSDTRMTLELRDAHGDMLFAEEGSVPGSAKMELRWALIEKLYRAVLSRLPFEGTVTGRTAATITVDLGAGSMRPNEIVELARIVTIQRHPLLGTVIGTDYVRTGRARITSVDRVLSFAEVIEEFPGEKVGPGQKVLRQQANLVHRGDSEVADQPDKDPAHRARARRGDDGSADASAGKDDANPLEDHLKGNFDHARPRFGAIGASLYYGAASNDQTQSGTETDYGGSGIGGEISGELWVTKNWILSVDYALQAANLSAPGGVTGGSSTWTDFDLMGGYRIYPEGMAEGIVLTGSVGYQSVKINIPSNSSLTLGGRSFSSLVLAADGDVRFLAKQTLNVGLSIMPFSSPTELGAALGTPSGGSVIGVRLGWNYQMTDELWFRIGLRYDVANGSYSDTGASVTVKHFAIGPGLNYLF